MSAAIGAALLLYFGFARLLEPTGTDLFSLSNLVLFHTVRWGGVLMAIVAAWLLTGHLVALLADGIVATLIGVLLIVTGVGMGVGGGDLLQTIINFFCGYMFFSSGVQNGRDFFRLAHRKIDTRTGIVQPTSPKTDEPPTPVPKAIEEVGLQESCEKIEPIKTPLNEPEPIDKPDSPPPPGGYLASFARKNADKES